MPSITKDNNREKIQQRTDANLRGIKKTENISTELSWEDLMDHTNSYAYVSTLASRIASKSKWYAKIIEQRIPTLITAPEWTTPLSLGIQNLPKLGDWNVQRLNFSFGEDFATERSNYNKMMSTPKTAICVFARKINLNNREYKKLQIYCLASGLKYSELPVIYRIDVLSIPGSKKFFGLRGVALVGGCIDGECPLFQINTDSKDGARMYNYKSNYTSFSIDPKDDVSNAYYDVKVLSGISTITEACDYTFKLFNVQSRMAIKNANIDFMHMINNIDKNKDVFKITSGADFVKAFLSRNIDYVNGKERQMIYNNEGQIQQSNTRAKQNIETQTTKTL